MESLSFPMSANIPPLLRFFRTSALVSVLIYEKEHTQKQRCGNLTIAKKYWHEKKEDNTQHTWNEQKKQQYYLHGTTHPPPSDCIDKVFQPFFSCPFHVHLMGQILCPYFNQCNWLHRPHFNFTFHSCYMCAMWHEAYFLFQVGFLCFIHVPTVVLRGLPKHGWPTLNPVPKHTLCSHS